MNIFGINFDAQWISIMIAFLAVIIPLIWNLITRQDKKKELQLRGTELYIALKKEHEYDEDIGFIFSKQKCLKLITGYNTNLKEYETLKFYDDPINALQTFKNYHLRIKNFPDSPKVVSRFKALLFYFFALTLGIGLLPFMAQMTYINFKGFQSTFNVKNHDENKTETGKLSLATNRYLVQITSKQQETKVEGSKLEKKYSPFISMDYILRILYLLNIVGAFILQILLISMFIVSIFKMILYSLEPTSKIEKALKHSVPQVEISVSNDPSSIWYEPYVIKLSTWYECYLYQFWIDIINFLRRD